MQLTVMGIHVLMNRKLLQIYISNVFYSSKFAQLEILH